MAESGTFQFSIKRKKVVGRSSLWLEAPGEVRLSKGDFIDLGSGSSCSVVFGDPVVQERHARVRLAADRFLLEDLATATGTYRNGWMVSEPCALVHGDQLVLGASRVTVELLDAAGQPARAPDGRPLLTLALEEGGFRFVSKSAMLFQKKKTGEGAEPVVEVGSLAAVGSLATKDQWVYAETRFGKNRALYLANWGAVVAAVLVPFSLFTSFGKELVNPGEVSSLHADALAQQGLDCGACHVPFEGPLVGRCGSCHASIVEPWRHPFQKDSAAAFQGLDGACEACHREHQGPVLAVPEGPDTCQSCHAAEEMTVAAVGGALEARLLEGRGSLPRPVRVAFNEFSHAAHLADGLAIACGGCHARASELPSRSTVPSGREFEVVRFRTCMTCHGADRSHWEAKGWPLSDPPLHGLVVDWHGSTEDPSKCTQCHTEDVHEGRLRMDRTPDRGSLAFDVQRRSHALEIEQHLDSRACEECHAKGSVAPKDGKGVAFWHGMHLAALAPSGANPSDELARDCQLCHSDLADAGSLAEVGVPGTVPQLSEHCGTCHKDEGNRPLAIVATGSSPEIPREREDFPHGKHLEVEGGCFRCHAFDPSDALQSAQPTTTVRNCSECHSDHRSMAGGACARCHGFDEAWVVDPVEPRRFSAWRGDSLYKDWRNGGPLELAEPPALVADSFKHFSAGHRQASEDGACLTCHAGPGGTELRQARTILEVPIPQEPDAGCRDCHVLEKKRFHWE